MNEDLLGCGLASEVRSRGQGMHTLVSNLSGTTKNAMVLCHHIRGKGSKSKLQDTDSSNR
jgi:hypothetical protein